MTSKSQDHLDFWERQPKESSKAYAAFRIYRQMGAARSLFKVAKEQFKSDDTVSTLNEHQKKRRLITRKRNLAKWSKKYHWVERVDAWDFEEDRLERISQKKTVREMKKRLAEQAMLIQTKGLQKIVEIDPETLTEKEALDYFVKGTEIEARYREVPDLKIEHSGSIEAKQHGFERIIAEDEETRNMIDDILTRLSANKSSRVRTISERGEMDSSSTP